MEKLTSLSVGVVLAREVIDHPRQDHRWRPIEVLVGVSKLEPGVVVNEGDGFVHYFAGTFDIELHRKETEAYVVNIENDPPSVYVVLCEADDEDDWPLPYTVRLVTVSPYQAQDFLDTGEDIVEALAMNEPLKAWMAQFISRHHTEQKFVKRQRDRLSIADEKFGQEPIAVVRARSRQN